MKQTSTLEKSHHALKLLKKEESKTILNQGFEGQCRPYKEAEQCKNRQAYNNNRWTTGKIPWRDLVSGDQRAARVTVQRGTQM